MGSSLPGSAFSGETIWVFAKPNMLSGYSAA
jgi:hypothetical protein